MRSCADTAPNAYEKVVDRLLASPRYGERMAARWLDAARYADTNGYQTDGERSMWRWRDWVIDAFNRNMPFDQFTIEQIAGDMLPHATLDQKIATGFNRNHRGNGEGGIIAEEYAVEYVGRSRRDHVHVFGWGSRWAARAATITNTIRSRRKSSTSSSPSSTTFRRWAGRSNTATRRRWSRRRHRAQQRSWRSWIRSWMRLGRDSPRFNLKFYGPQRAWEKAVQKPCRRIGRSRMSLVAHYAWMARPRLRRGSRRDADFAPGKLGQAASFDGKRFIEAGNVAAFGFYDKFTLAAWIYPTADRRRHRFENRRRVGSAGLRLVSERRQGSAQPGHALAG